ncbi:uncharacterized protein MONOS_3675 [Monocercomonoides exilis]|uniref:uncharacterized protein n=1 Tax=Monocercomonoides exilis TaxID=2049356 RepID=UPI00355ABAC4|nr:hypothetical protein MONOS_3675 [Monocercomonoides exilis]|eukprot:MONOS_3675.1-p1 / transcript=MONOS_3675.1 / gene=MONOS_3675 / organism=Monocercomonoides_exilis_PA203 / gene_product=unspecified product / transcript_product=unspecified product / location=Mono_scaffold00089:5848-7597(+) / protein_length=533 / sequence_SO=supercontig / SO=protein_coding / is_pseudo=false
MGGTSPHRKVSGTVFLLTDNVDDLPDLLLQCGCDGNQEIYLKRIKCLLGQLSIKQCRSKLPSNFGEEFQRIGKNLDKKAASIFFSIIYEISKNLALNETDQYFSEMKVKLFFGVGSLLEDTFLGSVEMDEVALRAMLSICYLNKDKSMEMNLLNECIDSIMQLLMTPPKFIKLSHKYEFTAELLGALICVVSDKVNKLIAKKKNIHLLGIHFCHQISCIKVQLSKDQLCIASEAISLIENLLFEDEALCREVVDDRRLVKFVVTMIQTCIEDSSCCDLKDETFPRTFHNKLFEPIWNRSAAIVDLMLHCCELIWSICTGCAACVCAFLEDERLLRLFASSLKSCSSAWSECAVNTLQSMLKAAVDVDKSEISRPLRNEQKSENDDQMQTRRTTGNVSESREQKVLLKSNKYISSGEEDIAVYLLQMMNSTNCTSGILNLFVQDHRIIDTTMTAWDIIDFTSEYFLDASKPDVKSDSVAEQKEEKRDQAKRMFLEYGEEEGMDDILFAFVFHSILYGHVSRKSTGINMYQRWK